MDIDPDKLSDIIADLNIICNGLSEAESPWTYDVNEIITRLKGLWTK